MSLWILFFPNNNTSFSFSSLTWIVLNFWILEATSIKFNLLYSILLITTNFIKQLKKVWKFAARLLCNPCISNYFGSNIKINDLNNNNTDIKKISLAKESTFHKIILLRFFRWALCIRPLIYFASFFILIALLMNLTFSFNSYLLKMVLISPSYISQKSFNIHAKQNKISQSIKAITKERQLKTDKQQWLTLWGSFLNTSFNIKQIPFSILKISVQYFVSQWMSSIHFLTKHLKALQNCFPVFFVNVQKLLSFAS